ncbi:MAG: MMPL family transporter [Verrucomicrobia bacterium]|nr:MMPL family transporter [Verrucomicrobiota bacterium]
MSTAPKSGAASWVDRCLHGWAKRIVHRRQRVLWIVLLLVVVCGGVTAARLVIRNNTLDLIRKDSPVFQKYLAYMEEFDVRDEIVVVLKSDRLKDSRDAANALAVKLKQEKGLDRVYYRHDFSPMSDRLLLLADEERLIGIRRQMEELATLVKGNKQALNLNGILGEASAKFNDPYLRKSSNWQEFIPFIEEFVRNLKRLAKDLETPANAIEKKGLGELSEFEADLLKNEYLSLGEDGKTILMLLRPTKEEQKSATPFTGVIQRVRKVVQETQVEFPKVAIGVTGEPVLLDDELRQSESDMKIATLITLTLITIMFFFAYGEISRPLLALVALLASVVVTLGITSVTIGHLNIISQAFIVMLLGLGIDFGIQILGRYEEEMGRGKSSADSVEITLTTTGKALLTGGGTTAAAFYAMCFNDFTGLTELGWIAGSGVVMALVASLSILPALLLWRDRNGAKINLGKLRLDRGAMWDRKLTSHPYLVLAVAAGITLIAWKQCQKVSFDHNLLHLQNPKMESVRLTRELLNIGDGSLIYGVVMADSVEQADDLAIQLRALPTVSKVRTLGDLVPRDQKKRMEEVSRIARVSGEITLGSGGESSVDVPKAKKDLEFLLESSQEGAKQAKQYLGLSGRARQAVATFEKLIPPLERAVAALDKLSLEEAKQRLARHQVKLVGSITQNLGWLKTQRGDRPLTVDDLPAELRQRYLSSHGKVLLEVVPAVDVWERKPNEEFVAEMQKIAPGATGTPVMNLEYIDLLMKSYIQASFYAAGVILLLIFLLFRNLKDLVLTLLPLGLGVLWLFGALGLFHIQLDPANIVTMPMILGIGVAYGVYVMDRYREEGGVRIFASSTGKAVVLSALTTLFGFGSMLFGQYRGLVSLGMVMSLGVIFNLISALVVLPQILALQDKRGGEEEEDPGPAD